MKFEWQLPISEEAIGCYEWCGFVVSSNIPLPRLRPSRGPKEDALGEIDFIWRSGEAPAHEINLRRWTLATWDGGTVDVSIGRDEERLIYETSDSGRFVLWIHTGRVDFYGMPSSDPRMVEHVLVHSVLGIWAGLNGVLCLHASAVARDGKASIFVGPSGTGKSTMALKLIDQGWTFVTDDIAVVSESNGEWFVQPGPRTLRIPGLDLNRGWLTRGKKEVPLEPREKETVVGELRLLRRRSKEVSLAATVTSLLRSHVSWAWASAHARKQLLNIAGRIVSDVIPTLQSVLADHVPCGKDTIRGSYAGALRFFPDRAKFFE